MAKRWATVALVAFLGIVAVLLYGYSRNEVQYRYDIDQAVLATGGNPKQGSLKISQYGCSTCHTIPGIPGANARVGPPLDGFAMRVYIAGEIPNTPDNLRHWIRKPHDINPHTAMPEMGVTDEDSKHIAAYLYTLR
jgi:cytochrome c